MHRLPGTGAWRETASLVWFSAQMFLGSGRSADVRTGPAWVRALRRHLYQHWALLSAPGQQGRLLGGSQLVGRVESENLGEVPRMTAPAPPELSSV